jgi:hypothetical protein
MVNSNKRAPVSHRRAPLAIDDADPREHLPLSLTDIETEISRIVSALRKSEGLE